MKGNSTGVKVALRAVALGGRHLKPSSVPSFLPCRAPCSAKAAGASCGASRCSAFASRSWLCGVTSGRFKL
ncbi:hypothetical protein HAX54_010352 [Datura stramonium]|uniref:Uncharacterized protein n=1 Tax=Datura stramonium TaxID=4076 RepID=A0ABS8RWM1_DATST|nr:hypothetical protein [Datura stramonium]